MSLKRNRSKIVDSELVSFINSFNEAIKKQDSKESVDMKYIAEKYRQWLNYPSLSPCYMSKILTRNNYHWNRKKSLILPIGFSLPHELNVFPRIDHIYISIPYGKKRSMLIEWLKNSEILGPMILTIFENADGILVLSDKKDFYSQFKFEYEVLPPEK